MSQEHNELKPCPFCGMEVSMERADFGTGFSILCPSCNLTMSGSSTLKNDLAWTWNNRKPVVPKILTVEQIWKIAERISMQEIAEDYLAIPKAIHAALLKGEV